MTAGTEPLVTAEMLRGFMDGLKARADVDAHPLTKLLAPLPEFERYVGVADGVGYLGDHIARGLRAIWRERFMPPVLSAERLVKWNAFFILEVMYFYPHVKGLPAPDTLKDAAVLLCDATHLALIVADGDAEQAARLIEGKPEFWARLIPASMTPAEQTLHSRRNASLGKLARELNMLLAKAQSIVSQLDAGLFLEQNAKESSPAANQTGENRQSDHQVSQEVQVAQPDPPLAPHHEALSLNARRMLEALTPAPGRNGAQPPTCHQHNLR